MPIADAEVFDMIKKIFSVACLWLVLALLVIACTDRDAYTWRFGGEDLSRILVTPQHAQLLQQQADANMAREREAAAQRSEQGEWDHKETYGGAPIARSAMDETCGLNLMWGRYEVMIDCADAADLALNVVSAGRQAFIRGGEAAFTGAQGECSFFFDLTDSAERVMIACDAQQAAKIQSVTVRRAGQRVFSADLAAYAALLGAVLTWLLVLTWDESEHGPERRRDALVIACTALFAGMPLLFHGLYAGHDLHFHLNRIEGIAAGLRAGQFPVRIHASTLLGYGYAAPQFYPELLLYIPAVLRNLGVSLSASVRVFEMGINLAAALSCYFSARRIFEDRKAALASSVIYTLCLYRIANLYVRATIGESLAMIFFPMLIAAMFDVLTGDRRRWPMLAAAMTGIFMSHLLSTLFAVGFCALAAMACAARLVREPKRILAILMAAVLTALCSLWFVVPFLSYSADSGINTSVALNTYEHVMRLGGFLVGFPGDHQALPMEANDFAYTVGVVPGYAMLIGCALLLLARYMHGKKQMSSMQDRCALALLMLGALALALSTDLFPWKTLCYLPRPYSTLFMQIQFPWRFVGVAAPLLAMAGAWGYMRVKKHRGVMLGAVIALSAVLAGYMMQGYVQRQAPMLAQDSFCDTRIIQSEYLYHGTPKAALAAGEIVAGKAEEYAVHDYCKQGTNLSFVLDVPKGSAYVEIPLLYYPGYSACTDDMELLVTRGENNVIRLYRIREGSNIPVNVWFESPKTWRIAEGASVLGLLVLCAAILMMNKRRSA